MFFSNFYYKLSNIKKIKNKNYFIFYLFGHRFIDNSKISIQSFITHGKDNKLFKKIKHYLI